MGVNKYLKIALNYTSICIPLLLRREHTFPNNIQEMCQPATGNIISLVLSLSPSDRTDSALGWVGCVF